MLCFLVNCGGGGGGFNGATKKVQLHKVQLRTYLCVFNVGIWKDVMLSHDLVRSVFLVGLKYNESNCIHKNHVVSSKF